MGLHSVPGPQYVVSTIRHTAQDSFLSDPACGNKELFSLMAGGDIPGHWLPVLLATTSGASIGIVLRTWECCSSAVLCGRSLAFEEAWVVRT